MKATGDASRLDAPHAIHTCSSYGNGELDFSFLAAADLDDQWLAGSHHELDDGEHVLADLLSRAPSLAP